MFCHITTRIEGDTNQDLLQKKGGRGFPHLVFMDSEGNVIAKHQGQRDAAGFEASLLKATAYMELKAKADAGDKAAKAEFLVTQLEMGAIPLSEFEEKIKEAGELSADLQARLDGVRANAEFSEIMQSIGQKPENEAVAEAGPKLLEMKKAGHVPAGENEFSTFHSILLEYAFTQKDAAQFEESLGALRERFGSNPQAKKFFEAQETRLAELKGGK
ncbi:MAG: hypothetical protein AAB434_00780 [Planctomycetota bacterium]